MLFQSYKNRYCTIPEYCAMIREEERVRREEAHERAVKFMVSCDKKEIKTMDQFIGERIMKNPRVKRAAITFLGMTMYTQSVLAKVDEKMSEQAKRISNQEFAKNFDKKNWELLDYLRLFGFWLCLFMCLFEVLMALSKGDTKQISRIVIKYLLGYSSLYLIPWIFNLIAQLFS